MKIASFIKIALFINEHKRKEIWDLRFEVAETFRQSDFRRQISCVPCNVPPTYDENLCAGRFLDSTSFRSK